MVNNHNVLCAVCLNSERKVLLTIPARTSCPPLWTIQYNGYLMAEAFLYQRRATACVDRNPEAVHGQATDTDGALFYYTEAVCNGINCPS